MNQYKCDNCGYIGYDPREPDDFAWDFLVCDKCHKGKWVFVKVI